MKDKLTAIITSVLSTIVAMLGFNACSSTEDMYGTPHADFRISGLVTDEKGLPLDQARVIVRHVKENGGKYLYHYGCDTLTTNSSGKYQDEVKVFPSKDQKALIVCQDPQGKYKPDSTEIALNFNGGDHGWYVGVATEEVNFKLKKTDDN